MVEIKRQKPWGCMEGKQEKIIKFIYYFKCERVESDKQH